MIRTPYFYDRLGAVNDTFRGFFPRWTLPGTVMKAEADSKINSTQTMISIDSAKEVYVDVGNNFPPTVLKRNEMMIPTEVANYLGKKKGDTALLSLDLSSMVGKDYLIKFLEIITEHMDEIKFDFDARTITYEENEPIPFSSVGFEYEPYINFTIAETFEKADAKFSMAWGNVALLDCHYIMDELFDSILDEIKPLFILKHALWKQIHDEIVVWQTWTAYNDVNFCTWAFQLDGVLKDEASYYLNSFD